MTPEQRRTEALERMLLDATWVASNIMETKMGEVKFTSVTFTDEKYGRLAGFKKQVEELNK